MSASGWSICPKCLAEAQSREAMERAVVMDSYGKVPVDEFDAARDALEPVDPEDHRTLREDYEFYDAKTGTVRYYYGCGPAHALVAVLRNGRCSPWSHDWTKTPISGGWGRPRELWRCTKCTVVKAKGD